MTATARSTNPTEDRLLGRISRNLSDRNTADLDVTSAPCARPTTTVWRRGDSLPTPEATAPVAPKPRIRPDANAAVIVAKPDPAIAAEAKRKADDAAFLARSEQLRRERIQNELDRQAEERKARRVAAEAKLAERDAFAASEKARIERERAERDEAERVENARVEALRLQAEKDEAERNKSASPESLAALTGVVNSTPKTKATTPKVIEEPSSRRKPGQGISLEMLRATSRVPIVIPQPPIVQQTPTHKPVEMIPHVPKRSNVPKSEWEIAADAERAEKQAFIARIRNLCPVVVARLHRDVIGVRKTWPSVERMVELATQYSSYHFKKEDLLPFIAACETAMAKIKK